MCDEILCEKELLEIIEMDFYGVSGYGMRCSYCGYPMTQQTRRIYICTGCGTKARNDT